MCKCQGYIFKNYFSLKHILYHETTHHERQEANKESHCNEMDRPYRHKVERQPWVVAAAVLFCFYGGKVFRNLNKDNF